MKSLTPVQEAILSATIMTAQSTTSDGLPISLTAKKLTGKDSTVPDHVKLSGTVGNDEVHSPIFELTPEHKLHQIDDSAMGIPEYALAATFIRACQESNLVTGVTVDGETLKV